MKARFVRLLLSIFALSALMLTSVSPALAEAVTTTEVTIGITNTIIENPCTGELVKLSGTVLILVHETVDANGSTHTRLLRVAQGVTAVGLLTGTEYQVSGPSPNSSINIGGPLPMETTFGADFHVISHGTEPNWLVHALIHTTTNANGEVTADISDFSSECRG